MIWILPMAGNGKRTAVLGKFKPFIKVKNKKIIEWFLISIKNKIKNKDTIILITTKDFEKKFNFKKNMKIIIKKYKLNIKNLIFKFIDATPKGPAYTVYSIKNILIYLNKPCIVVNPDQYIDFDLPKKIIKDNLYLPIHFNNHGNSSYVKLNKRGKIVEIKEKNLISNYASSGVYIFGSSLLLKRILNQITKIKLKNEINMSELINKFLKKNKSKVNPLNTLAKYDLGNVKNIKNFSIKDFKVY